MIPPHPLAEMLPLITGGEYDDLVASIKSYGGLREPITLYEGKVLDGRNRLRACVDAGIDPVTVEFDGSDPIAFVRDKNLHRRHLTASQKAMFMVECQKLMRPGNVAAQKDNGGLQSPPVSAAEAAKQAGVGARIIKDANVVHANGTHTEIADVKNGKHSAKATANKIRERKSLQKRKPRMVPTGYQNLNDAVRAAMKLERSGLSKTKVLKQIKIASQTYNVARDILLLSELPDLSTTDKNFVHIASQQFDEGVRVSECADLIKSVVAKVWGPNGHRFTTDKKRTTAFCESLSYVVTTCNASVDMNIPHLDKEQRKEAIADIAEAIGSLQKLNRRLKGN